MGRSSSAGVLAYRWRGAVAEFLLVHPGGPYWRGKDIAAWSIPKGLMEADETGWVAAAREFEEEVGLPVKGVPQALTSRRQPSGKTIHCWMVEPTSISPDGARATWSKWNGRVAQAAS